MDVVTNDNAAITSAKHGTSVDADVGAGRDPLDAVENRAGVNLDIFAHLAEAQREQLRTTEKPAPLTTSCIARVRTPLVTAMISSSSESRMSE